MILTCRRMGEMEVNFGSEKSLEIILDGRFFVIM